MKKSYCLFLFAALLLTACREKPSQNNNFEALSQAQSSMIQSFKLIDSLWNQGIIHADQWDGFINEALTFYEKYPEESLTPDMLNNAGNLSLTMANYYKGLSDSTGLSSAHKYANKALSVYDIIIKVYPDYEHLNMVYLNKAIVYDEILGDKDSAELEYREYLHKFPNDPASASFSDYLQNDGVGKSAEEIFQSFSKE